MVSEYGHFELPLHDSMVRLGFSHGPRRSSRVWEEDADRFAPTHKACHNALLEHRHKFFGSIKIPTMRQLFYQDEKV